MLDWKTLFREWYNQKSNIVQFPKILEKIYPPDYTISKKELSAWRAMFRNCGCYEITPYSKKIASIEFWTKSDTPDYDKNVLETLYNTGLLCVTPPEPIIIDNSEEVDTFWESFRSAYKSNIDGACGKIRILSIIAEKFPYSVLKQRLKVRNQDLYNMLLSSNAYHKIRSDQIQ